MLSIYQYLNIVFVPINEYLQNNRNSERKLCIIPKKKKKNTQKQNRKKMQQQQFGEKYFIIGIKSFARSIQRINNFNITLSMT